MKSNKKKDPIIVHNDRGESIRLNKYISESGFCSRREADKFIESGKVTVDGVKAVMGTKVQKGQKVRVNGKLISKVEEMVYIVLNKPVGITCTTEHKVRGNIVDGIVCPGRGIEIYVDHEQAMAGRIGPPPLVLPVLEQVVLAWLATVAYHIGNRFAGEWRHVGNGYGVCQFDGLEPSTVHALVTGIWGWASAVVIRSEIAPQVHKVPEVHAEVIPCCVVHVGDAEAMAELVASRAYAVDVRTSIP